MRKLLLLIPIILYTHLTLHAGFFENIVKSSGEEHINNYLTDLDTLLEELHIKLNKRNPKSFESSRIPLIRYAIQNVQDIHYAKLSNDCIELLNQAFDKTPSIKDRNDLIIIALHKMIYNAFNRKDFKFTALSYDLDKLNRLYKNMQILFWRIKSYKDYNGDYLFLTWQNNWQVELDRKLRQGITLEQAIGDLHYINTRKETLFDASNESFAQIYAQMLYIMEKIISESGGEPQKISFALIKTIAFLPL
jgi:hypothetical protein